jgi:hypothetical protein
MSTFEFNGETFYEYNDSHIPRKEAILDFDIFAVDEDDLFKGFYGELYESTTGQLLWKSKVYMQESSVTNAAHRMIDTLVERDQFSTARQDIERQRTFFKNYEFMRTWEDEGFKLYVFDTHSFMPGERHHHRLAYRLYDNDKLIFDGEHFGCSPLHAIDSDGAVAELLGFLSLKPGDTDAEYFEKYFPHQMKWIESGRAEDLSILQLYLEESSKL